MSKSSLETFRDVLVFTLLCGIGVAGRWAQPAWGFTPIAAVALFAGAYFSRWPIAAMVPLSVLAISDLLLPTHDNWAVLAVVYGVMTVPIVLGRMLRGGQRFGNQPGLALLRWGLCGFVPATLFFLSTNFAVWAFKSNYEKTWAGLVQCYGAAVPFYRQMLAGDLFYLVVLMGCFALAGGRAGSRAGAGLGDQPARILK